jgi:hypothetical protein
MMSSTTSSVLRRTANSSTLHSALHSCIIINSR